ncbi:MAG TPA: hypothetical protein DCQ31_10240, partial [Bacteroidales bacterium]|nr:hypothetical protein [Bacteroidales bacterium]
MKHMEKSILKRLRFVIFTLTISLQAFSQQVELKITDITTAESCSFASVVFYKLNGSYLHGMVADKDGKASYKTSEEVKFVVSFVGYKKFEGTIKPGETKQVELEIDYIGTDEVVITGQFQPRKVDQSIFKIDLINSKTLTERGVTNLADALS